MEATKTWKELVQDTWQKRPLVISGPCSAETEEQVIATATRLAATGKVDMLRAGIWKPRTKPGLFEGIGTKGLPWLQQAKKITGLPITVEVATAKHVEDALNFDVDMLWIGARTTVNPFSVQEVADALRGVDVPVLIKNPINPDVELWTGAVERVAKAGIKQIGLIHRGFSSYGNTEYRNAPMWHRFGFMDHQCALSSVVSTLLALYQRDRTGRATDVAGSLLGAGVLTRRARIDRGR